MKFSKIELPSNRKFGFFFTLVFAVTAAYLFKTATISWSCAFAITSLIFLLITMVKANILLPLNKLWMRFGLLLSMIVSPIVLGIVFFGLFTPIAFLMRIYGRDELKLKFMNKTSHWILRSEPLQTDLFKNQF